MANDGKTMETVIDLIFLGSIITAESELQPQNQKTLATWKKNYDKQHIKEQRHYFADKGPYSQSCDFSSSHAWV